MTARRLADEYAPRPVLATSEDFRGGVWTVRTERVDLGAAGEVVRDYVVHPGAVAALALDDEDRVLLVRQYRHPVRSMCWELPAGLRDVDDEPPLDTARRELAEETGYTAATWSELLTFHTTSGGSTEELAVFLARELTAVPDDERHARDGEELDMEVAWFPFDEVLEAILAGRVANAALVAGVLALAAVRRQEGGGEP